MIVRRAALTIALSLIVCTAVSAAAVRSKKTHTVTMEAMRFQPAALTIRSGDTVVWVNKDLVGHTATLDGTFDSKLIQPGKSWKQTFRTKGDLAYVCTYHPAMKATLRVE